MAKIDRYDGNVEPFASQATTNKRTTFGTEDQGDDTLDGNVTPGFLTGWEIVGPSDSPKLQDFNALGFTLSQYLAYLHQSGVPEWNGSQEYQVGSYVNRNGVLYVCQTADHVSVTPPESDGANWEPDQKLATETEAGVVEKATTAEAKGGTADKFPDAAGMRAAIDDGMAYQNVAVFDTSGTTSWTVPQELKDGRRKALVTVIGGGGGGAFDASRPGGGGGGGVAIGLVDLSEVNSVTVTVGAGGTGGQTGQSLGAGGGSSSFGSFLSATGGTGGDKSGNAAASGQGVGGDINYGIGLGGAAIRSATDTVFGGYGGGASSIPASNGGSPSAPGHGGGGRTTNNGMSGFDGTVIVEW